MRIALTLGISRCNDVLHIEIEGGVEVRTPRAGDNASLPTA